MTRALATLRRQTQYQWASTVLRCTVLQFTLTRTLASHLLSQVDTAPLIPAARLYASPKSSAYIPRKTIRIWKGARLTGRYQVYQVRLIKLRITLQRTRGRIPTNSPLIQVKRIYTQTIYTLKVKFKNSNKTRQFPWIPKEIDKQNSLS